MKGLKKRKGNLENDGYFAERFHRLTFEIDQNLPSEFGENPRGRWQRLSELA